MPKLRTKPYPPIEPLKVPSEFRIIEASGSSDFQLEAAI